MSIERIMSVNLIGGLPEELMNIIKDYSFYDKKTWSIISHNRELKKQLLNTLNSLVVITHPAIGYWSIQIQSIDPSEINFEGVNCLFCGEFRGFNFVDETPALCICNNPSYLIGANEDSDEDYDDYYDDDEYDYDDYDDY